MSLSTLCLACGHCCDGTLFRFVPLSPDEADDLFDRGLPVFQRRGQLVMPLGCSKLEGRCCSLYDARPQGCRRFVCVLGQRLEAGQISLPDALDVVTELDAALAHLDALVPPGPGSALRRAYEAFEDPRVSLSEEAAPAARAVEALVRADFVPPPG
jgi:hypothetical protein